MCVLYKSFKNTERKGEVADAFSPFLTVISTLLLDSLPFSTNLKLLPANSINFKESKVYHLANIMEIGKTLETSIFSSPEHEVLSELL